MNRRLGVFVFPGSVLWADNSSPAIAGQVLIFFDNIFFRGTNFHSVFRDGTLICIFVLVQFKLLQFSINRRLGVFRSPNSSLGKDCFSPGFFSVSNFSKNAFLFQNLFFFNGRKSCEKVPVLSQIPDFHVLTTALFFL